MDHAGDHSFASDIAEQEELVRRRVALKIIKLGMDTRKRHSPLRSRAPGVGHDGHGHRTTHGEVLTAGVWRSLGVHGPPKFDHHPSDLSNSRQKQREELMAWLSSGDLVQT